MHYFTLTLSIIMWQLPSPETVRHPTNSAEKELPYEISFEQMTRYISKIKFPSPINHNASMTKKLPRSSDQSSFHILHHCEICQSCIDRHATMSLVSTLLPNDERKLAKKQKAQDFSLPFPQRKYPKLLKT